MALAIQRFKLNKASGYDGLPVELFKAGVDELVRCMHHLLCNIWSLESMPIDWYLSLLCPVLKKGDATICSNYRGLSLLTIAYRILSSVLCERLKPLVLTSVVSDLAPYTRSLLYPKFWRRHEISRSSFSKRGLFYSIAFSAQSNIY